MNQRGSNAPCPGCGNHQPFLKLPRWLPPLSRKGVRRRPRLLEVLEGGRRRDGKTPRRSETQQIPYRAGNLQCHPCTLAPFPSLLKSHVLADDSH